MHECFENPERPREFWKPVLFISLLLPTIYYMFYYKADAKVKDTGPFSETILTDPTEFVTDGGLTIVVKRKPFEKDLDKMFNVEAHVQKTNTVDRKKHSKYSNGQNLPLCPMGVLKNVTLRIHEELEKSVNFNNLYPMVQMGGYYSPPDCRSRHKVAILVPYRDREENLKVFMYNIHPYLIRQRLEYRIFVIQQSGNELFNKGRIFNAGYLEIRNNDDWQCIIFHDVDLLPYSETIPYTCPILPRHMCSSIVMNENPGDQIIFGGVTAMTMYQYKKVNGYSNLYWGWGGEDLDMFKRIHVVGLGITKYSKNFARYISLNHPERILNPKRHMLLATAEERYKTDGLSSLRYRVKSYSSKPLYTHIVVDVNPPALPDYITEASVTFTL